MHNLDASRVHAGNTGADVLGRDHSDERSQLDPPNRPRLHRAVLAAEVQCAQYGIDLCAGAAPLLLVIQPPLYKYQGHHLLS